jgi:dUTP pyrophosphatase
VPRYATPGSACFDLHTVGGGLVEPLSAKSFPIGLAVEVPEDHVMLIFSRSGHGFKHAVRLTNCVGVIDSDYRGEVGCKLHNDSAQEFMVNAGDRVAQAMILPVKQVEFIFADELSDTERGTGGYGSTGA